ncbi:competence/damage-inducible protein A [Haliangium ochraceum]|uniref:competence/damage-inducible protein A n=1 Tax=Haliangium ochraceum TaxID=80816 RepID=UPI00019B9507|nr:competence/damage-inducible protein A [Haliangium ochraceum]
MRAEILTIGDELCRGEIVDTNSAWLAEALWDLDVTVTWMTSCRDTDEDMREAFANASKRADLVLVSGGLGPTEDDRTVDVLAAMLGVEAAVDEAARAIMEERFAQYNFRLTPNNLRQVRVPAGARVLANSAGLAPGFEVSLDDVPIFCMPGIPSEMRAIFTEGIRERIIALRESRGERAERIARRIYRVFGAGESHIATAMEGAMDDIPGASLHFQVKFPEVLVKVVIRDRDEAAARARLHALDGTVRSRLGRKLYGVDDDELGSVLGRALRERGLTLATAESCTGGMIGSLLTEVPGSSAYFYGGAVTYTNEEKTRQLGVSPEIFVEHGAVSEACVRAMAQGARERFATDYAVAVSGVAGPGGGTEEKPVGTVWLAVAGPAGCTARRMFWPRSRGMIRRLSAYWAMAMVLRALGGEDGASELPTLGGEEAGRD